MQASTNRLTGKTVAYTLRRMPVIGVNVAFIPVDQQVAAAQLAEELGFESVWLGEHVLVPPAGSELYPYGAAPPFDAAKPWIEPLSTLSFVAAHTSRIRLATGVLVLPLRDIFITARAAATLDVLSGGRLILGVGAGWLEPEFSITGHADRFARRGSVMKEMVEVLTTLFADGPAAHEGERCRFSDVVFEPKPLQRPRPPLLLGGNSAIALRRTAELADGWYGATLDVAATAAIVERLTELRGDRPPLEISIRAPRPVDAEAYAEIGVNRIVA